MCGAGGPSRCPGECNLHPPASHRPGRREASGREEEGSSSSAFNSASSKYSDSHGLIPASSRCLRGGQRVPARCDLAARKTAPQKQNKTKQHKKIQPERSGGEKRGARICLCYRAYSRRKIKPFRSAFDEAVFAGKHDELQTQLRILTCRRRQRWGCLLWRQGMVCGRPDGLGLSQQSCLHPTSGTNAPGCPRGSGKGSRPTPSPPK